jgi:ubiquitin carboxyl-terminal hydrolase 9/24
VQDTPNQIPVEERNANETNFRDTGSQHSSDQSVTADSGTRKKDDFPASTSCSCSSSKVFSAEQESSSDAASCKEDPPFPISQLASLEEKINNPRWVIPVLPDQELEVLLDAAIELCRNGTFHAFCS